MIHSKQNPLTLLAVCFILISNLNLSSAQRQTSFMGMLEYDITPADKSKTHISDATKMFVYTNDTITRTENFTHQLGQQVAIRHMEKQKSYLLLINDLGKFALQTNYSISDSIKKESQYIFKKKWFKRKIAGKKANRMIVYHPDFKEPIEFLYLKRKPNKYLNIYTEIPGLLLKYSIVTKDGILDYKLVNFKEYIPNKDLFGIPSDFNRITFDEFIDEIIKAKEEAQ